MNRLVILNALMAVCLPACSVPEKRLEPSAMVGMKYAKAVETHSLQDHPSLLIRNEPRRHMIKSIFFLEDGNLTLLSESGGTVRSARFKASPLTAEERIDRLPERWRDQVKVQDLP